MPDAADVALCWWEQRIGCGPEGYVQRVVPDGCSDVIVSAGGGAVVVGPTMAVSLPHLAPGSHLRGLRFRTEALASALGLPGTEIRDLTVPLEAIGPASAAQAMADSIWERRVPSPWQAAVVDGRIRYAVRRILTSPGAQVANVAEEVGVTGRHLRRMLLEHTGLGPRSLQRVGRLQQFLRLADTEWPAASLATMAVVAGYADQAHLSRETRELAGITPRALLRERLGP